MSFAWETTTDDVAQVLRQHGVTRTDEEISAIHDQLDFDRIEEAVLAYADFDDQVASALDEIEDMLIEQCVLLIRREQKRYRAP